MGTLVTIVCADERKRLMTDVNGNRGLRSFEHADSYQNER